MKTVVAVYVMNDNREFLMIYNKKQGAWLPPGGFVEEGEDVLAAVLRETSEEVGNDIGTSLKFVGNVTFRESRLDARTELLPTPLFVAKQTLSDNRIVINYVYVAISNAKVNSTKENMMYKWHNQNDINKLDTFDNVKMQMQYISNNFDKLEYFPVTSEQKIYNK